MPSDSQCDANADTGQRRGFLGALASAVMAGGLAGGYGLLAAHAGRFLYPSKGDQTAWQFVATIDQLKKGSSLPFQTPAGAMVVVARQSEGDTAEDFVALSSICPHLGCVVHWESHNDRFFCPCHNGAFDASGKATEGPPATANQVLEQFPLKVENGLLYILVATDSVTGSRET
ncbi:MAG: Rieske (2Fe-2S) protein [Pirellulales bacterium]|nr:Rieske (2Fe-2S) protein [Pirellulales bacterium]